MNRQYVNVLIIFLVALLVEFGALFVFMTAASAASLRESS